MLDYMCICICICVYVYMCYINPSLYSVHGRQGMEKVDFWEKTTAAKTFGPLHELFIYGLAGSISYKVFNR